MGRVPGDPLALVALPRKAGPTSRQVCVSPRVQELSVPKVFEKLLRAGEGRVLKRLEGIAQQVAALEEDFEKLTDEELRDETEAFKKRLADGESIDELLPEAFAAVREASKRTLGKRHFDVQIMGGAALHMGNGA